MQNQPPRRVPPAHPDRTITNAPLGQSSGSRAHANARHVTPRCLRASRLREALAAARRLHGPRRPAGAARQRCRLLTHTIQSAAGAFASESRRRPSRHWAADIGLIARSSSDKIGEFADAFAYAVRATNRALDAQYGVRRPTPCPTYFALVGNAPQTQSVAACVAGRAPVSHTCGCSAAQPLAAVRIGAAQGRARKP